MCAPESASTFTRVLLTYITMVFCNLHCIYRCIYVCSAQVVTTVAQARWTISMPRIVGILEDCLLVAISCPTSRVSNIYRDGGLCAWLWRRFQTTAQRERVCHEQFGLPEKPPPGQIFWTANACTYAIVWVQIAAGRTTQSWGHYSRACCVVAQPSHMLLFCLQIVHLHFLLWCLCNLTTNCTGC